MLLGAAGLGTLAALMCLRPRLAPGRRKTIFCLLASVGVIAGWYLVFRNHTAQHVTFMVGILVWPIAVGPVCALLALWPDRRPAASPS